MNQYFKHQRNLFLPTDDAGLTDGRTSCHDNCFAQVVATSASDVPLQVFLPEAVLEVILTRMKDMAEALTGRGVREAVLVVPADFDYHRRSPIWKVAADSGLDVLEIMKESEAALLARDVQIKADELGNLNEDYGDTEVVVVFNFGGSSLSVSVAFVQEWLMVKLVQSTLP